MKYEFKGTKQRWIAEPNCWADGCRFIYALTEKEQISIAYVECPIHGNPEVLTKEQSEANYYLIAAAPQLLQACIDMVDTLCGEQECEEELIKGLGNPIYAQLLKTKQAIHSALNIQE